MYALYQIQHKVQPGTSLNHNAACLLRNKEDVKTILDCKTF